MATGKPLNKKASPAKKSASKSTAYKTAVQRKAALQTPAGKPEKPGAHTPVYLRFVYAGMLLILLMGSFVRIASGKRSSRLATSATAAAQASGAGELSARALIFRRSGSPCDELTVSTAGQAVLAGCSKQGERQYQLSASEQQQLVGWLDKYRSFELSDPSTPQANAASTQLVFNGHGLQAPAAADIQALRAFAASLDNEIAAQP